MVWLLVRLWLVFGVLVFGDFAIGVVQCCSLGLRLMRDVLLSGLRFLVFRGCLVVVLFGLLGGLCLLSVLVLPLCGLFGVVYWWLICARGFLCLLA